MTWKQQTVLKFEKELYTVGTITICRVRERGSEGKEGRTEGRERNSVGNGDKIGVLDNSFACNTEDNPRGAFGKLAFMFVLYYQNIFSEKVYFIKKNGIVFAFEFALAFEVPRGSKGIFHRSLLKFKTHNL